MYTGFNKVIHFTNAGEIQSHLTEDVLVKDNSCTRPKYVQEFGDYYRL